MDQATDSAVVVDDGPRRWAVAVCRAAAVTALSVLGYCAALMMIVCLLLGYITGFTMFLVRPSRLACRAVTGTHRKWALRWSGIRIPTPYLEPTKKKRELSDPATWRDVLWLLGEPFVALPLLIACFLVGWAAGPSLLRLHANWARVLLGPEEKIALTRRVQDLTEVRAGLTDSQANEIRRIERDLHDGAQARIVAMGMVLDAAEQLVEKDPQAAKRLLAQARESSGIALTELRDLVRGIHPPVLAERGLVDAVRALALDCTLPVDVTADVPGRFEAPVESAAYFGIAESLTNAVKHANASKIHLDLQYADERLRMVMLDNGTGGADVSGGSGLRGIQRRLAAFDGTLEVASPPGGPTMITMELPCVSSSPRTSTSFDTV